MNLKLIVFDLNDRCYYSDHDNGDNNRDNIYETDNGYDTTMIRQKHNLNLLL